MTYQSSILLDAGFDALDSSVEYTEENEARTLGRHVGESPEQGLWCAVIIQAFIDSGLIASTTAPRRHHNKYRVRKARHTEDKDALSWLLQDRRDFSFVCMMANLNAYTVRRAALLLSASMTVSA